jgi:hypothetical protein
MTNVLRKLNDLPSAGIFVGAIMWYLAHDIAFYYSGHDCKFRWILPTVHFLALLITLWSGAISAHAWRKVPLDGHMTREQFVGGIGVAAAALFSLVIVWQGVATLIYKGCER